MIGTKKNRSIEWTVILLVPLLLWAVKINAQTNLPDIPDIKRVTVDHADGGVLVQWEPSSDTDIEFYTLYKQRNDVFQFVATFDGNTYEYKHMSGGAKNLAYAVTAIDTSGNESLFEQNVQRAVSASVEFDPCIPANNITWNAYQGWDGNISGYKIYGGYTGSTLQFLKFVSSSTLSYSQEAINTDSSYSYYIETVPISGLTSLSAIEQVSSQYPEAPQYLLVDYVSVIDKFTIELQFTADVSGPVNDFRVMKRSNAETPFAEVQTFMDANQSTISIQDEFSTSTARFEYMVQSLFHPPSCQSPLVISESNHGTNLLLGYELIDQVVTLNWTPYETYDNGLSGYTIQRRNGSGEFIDIVSVGPATLSWSEEVQSVINGFQSGELKYKVLALENQGNHGDPGVSISNIISVTVETNIKIPNAFTPGSNDMNFEFKPIIDFAPKDYSLLILDRNGRKLFETSSPGEAWDGRFRSGKFVIEGVYVYYIQFTDFTGKFKSYTGNVTVLYP